VASFIAFAFTPVIKGPWKLGMCSFTRRPITCTRFKDSNLANNYKNDGDEEFLD